MRIPKILHQTWHTLDQVSKNSKDSFMELHPDWGYRFWSNEDCIKLIKNSYPDFYDTWSNLNSNIKKWDTVRYLILNSFGGLYADIDFVFHKCLDPIIDFDKKIIFRSPAEFKSNATGLNHIKYFHKNPICRIKNHFILSQKGLPIWNIHIEHIKQKSILKPCLNVFDHVANNALAKSLQKCLEDGKLKTSDLLFLDHSFVINRNFKYEKPISNFDKKSLYAEHLVQGSWV